MESGKEKSGHDPDDPAGFPCVLPKADAQIHGGHDTPIGTCEPADLPVEHFFVGGVILELLELVEAVLHHPGSDEELHRCRDNGQQQADRSNHPAV